MKKTKRLTIAQRILTWFGIFVVSARACRWAYCYWLFWC